MPNTLAHIGLHGLATQSFLKDADLRWVYLGAIIPDLPWIFQRIFRLFSEVDLLDLRLYALIQASLFFSLILSGAFSLLSIRPRKTFLILASGAFFHLLFDAFQIKWANGVHFFAPFSWHLTQFAFVWPESFVSYAVTAFGFVYICYHWLNTLNSPSPFCLKPTKNLIASVVVILIYLLLPFVLLDRPENRNNHFVKTIRSVENRKGKPVEIDRAYYLVQGSEKMLKVFSGERIKVKGVNLQSSAVISIQGQFTDKNEISVSDYHIHSIFRDLASYVGLGLIATLWLYSAYRHVWPRA